MILHVNGSVYHTGITTVKATLNTAKYANRDKLSIVAIERNGVVMMLNEVFETEKELQEKVKFYKKSKFRVHITGGN